MPSDNENSDFSYFYEDEFYHDPDDSTPSPKSSLWRWMAALTLLAFVTLTSITYWPQNLRPLGDLLHSSSDLKKDLDPQLLAAVVKIEVESQHDIAKFSSPSRQGTGFNISPQGIIVTNHHVIEDAARIRVYFDQGQVYSAVDWSSNPELDLALIFLDQQDLPVLPLNETDPLAQEAVTIIGNPLGLSNIVVEGTILYKVKSDKLAEEAIAINAPIYPGNSGSPVINEQFQVVGVVFGTLKADFQTTPQDIVGLAMPVSQLSAWANNWKNTTD